MYLKKIGKDLKSYLTVETVWMIYKHTKKRCSKWSATIEMQIKTKMITHLLEWLKQKQKQNKTPNLTPNAGEYV